MFKVYCVEDDESIRQLIVYALENGGFESEGFEDGDEFFSRLSSSIPDLIILQQVIDEKITFFLGMMV